jgi:hypothetical protein
MVMKVEIEMRPTGRGSSSLSSLAWDMLLGWHSESGLRMLSHWVYCTTVQFYKVRAFDLLAMEGLVLMWRV